MRSIYTFLKHPGCSFSLEEFAAQVAKVTSCAVGDAHSMLIKAGIYGKIADKDLLSVCAAIDVLIESAEVRVTLKVAFHELVTRVFEPPVKKELEEVSAQKPLELLHPAQAGEPEVVRPEGVDSGVSNEKRREVVQVFAQPKPEPLPPVNRMSSDKRKPRMRSEKAVLSVVSLSSTPPKPIFRGEATAITVRCVQRVDPPSTGLRTLVAFGIPAGRASHTMVSHTELVYPNKAMTDGCNAGYYVALPKGVVLEPGQLLSIDQDGHFWITSGGKKVVQVDLPPEIILPALSPKKNASRKPSSGQRKI